MIVVDGETETKYYHHFNGLGSVVALSDSSADVVERYTYDVFGEPNTTSSVGNPYLFTSRRYDSETWLYYYRARYYDPHIGRFSQVDPLFVLFSIGFEEVPSDEESFGRCTSACYPRRFIKNIQTNSSLKMDVATMSFMRTFYLPYSPPELVQNFEGLNAYVYVTNNPINKVDPGGTIGIVGIVGIGLAVALVGHVAACFTLVGQCMDEVNKLREQYPCDPQKRWDEAMKTKPCKRAFKWCPRAATSSYVP